MPPLLASKPRENTGGVGNAHQRRGRRKHFRTGLKEGENSLSSSSSSSSPSSTGSKFDLTQDVLTLKVEDNFEPKGSSEIGSNSKMTMADNESHEGCISCNRKDSSSSESSIAFSGIHSAPAPVLVMAGIEPLHQQKDTSTLLLSSSAAAAPTQQQEQEQLERRRSDLEAAVRDTIALIQKRPIDNHRKNRKRKHQHQRQHHQQRQQHQSAFPHRNFNDLWVRLPVETTTTTPAPKHIYSGLWQRWYEGDNDKQSYDRSAGLPRPQHSTNWQLGPSPDIPNWQHNQGPSALQRISPYNPSLKTTMLGKNNAKDNDRKSSGTVRTSTYSQVFIWILVYITCRN